MNARMDDLFAPRPAVERPYIQTTPLSADALQAAIAAAAKQDEAVLAVFARYRQALSPSAVHAVGVEAGRRWLITSVRRSMTNLERAGLLVKGSVVEGPHGRPEHVWRLP